MFGLKKEFKKRCTHLQVMLYIFYIKKTLNIQHTCEGCEKILA